MKAFFAFAVGLLLGIAVAWQPRPLETVFDQYNHIVVYEDGSFSGELREDGTRFDGCLPGGLCND